MVRFRFPTAPRALLRGCAAALPLIVLGGCVTSRDAVVRATRPEPAYDRLYQRSIEVCATSRIRPRFAGAGGPAGHAVLFLKGVCRDPAAPYPRLRLCDPAAADPAGPESGTGVSVDRVLKNVNWVAVPGERLFFYGDVGRYELLDRQHLEAAVRRATEQGVFAGVETHVDPAPAAPGGGTVGERTAIDNFLGTDFALAYGRSAYCVRFPVPEAALARTVAYLNGLNDAYAGRGREYRWSGISDNCAHVLHNALAAAGLWERQSVRAFMALQFFNLAIPVDQFSDAALLAGLEIEDPLAVWERLALRRLVLREGWLPVGHGTLFRVIPVHQRNAVYDTELTFFTLTDLFGTESRRVGELLADARFTDVEYNLLAFERRYEALLAREARRRPGEPEDDGEYERFRAAYFAWGRRQLADVREKLALLYGGR
ncbi:MAG TPA: hypothetical protein VI078_13085 [bacterium]